MKTRKRLPAAVTQEDSSEDEDRRCSLRKRIRIEYTTEESSDGSDSEDKDSVLVEADRESNDEDEWDVTCGNKIGLLHVEKLKTGMDCIVSEGRWFSLSAFEKFGGKGAQKKWKSTILYKNKPLQVWIDRGALSPPPFKKRQSAASKSSNHDNSHPEESAAPSNHEDEVRPDKQPTETEEEQTDAQNGDLRNGIIIDIKSTVLQKKPKVILKKLENIRGDIKLQQNGSCPIKIANGKIDLETENTTCTEEFSEPQYKDKGKGASPQYIKNEKEPEVHGEGEDMHIEETPCAEDTQYTSEDTEVYEAGKTSLHESKNKIIHSEEGKMVVHSPTHLQSFAEDIPPDVNSPDPAQLLMERPPQVDSPCAIMDDTAPTPLTSTDLNIMDLDQLKREKIKWQLKVLKLQEEYYTLQLKKLKQ